MGKHSPRSGEHGQGAPGTDAQKLREQQAKEAAERKALEDKLRKAGKIK